MTKLNNEAVKVFEEKEFLEMLNREVERFNKNSLAVIVYDSYTYEVETILFNEQEYIQLQNFNYISNDQLSNSYFDFNGRQYSKHVIYSKFTNEIQISTTNTIKKIKEVLNEMQNLSDPKKYDVKYFLYQLKELNLPAFNKLTEKQQELVAKAYKEINRYCVEELQSRACIMLDIDILAVKDDCINFSIAGLYDVYVYTTNDNEIEYIIAG